MFMLVNFHAPGSAFPIRIPKKRTFEVIKAFLKCRKPGLYILILVNFYAPGFGSGSRSRSRTTKTVPVWTRTLHRHGMLWQEDSLILAIQACRPFLRYLYITTCPALTESSFFSLLGRYNMSVSATSMSPPAPHSPSPHSSLC
jgi:hypothetical protein